MNKHAESLTWTFKLGISAHRKIQQLCGHQENQAKSQQIYLNSLAVHAVNHYLNCMGWETDLENSGISDPLLSTLVDLADLEVKNYGKLECRPVLANDEFVKIPKEIQEDRIAYVVVQIDPNFKEATLLGFLPQATSSLVPINQLSCLQDLTVYLSQCRQQKRETIVNLSQWLENIFDTSWHSLENFLADSPQLVFRGSSGYSVVERGKHLELKGTEKSVNLCVGIKPTKSVQMDISVEVYPGKKQKHLPEELQLTIIDEKGQSVMQALAEKSQSLEFQFGGLPQETFIVKVTLGNSYAMEKFII